ncbi:biotin--[acetyl-CoA-carboxylase] ligase [Dermatobacter hominis]|uniref:biotin--[acetyl-CoA-carboxylase] ligase n=1 Tax=Dermatobacter hominis TaxID=2884263 RepID=UPI001D0FEABF|nr:biotin--[acetyl-CoA-carboxylase] ligase [Dermatobacter hominis]UDY35589.1 biotin--[acetyl-CoA-carboxylase] ligase [Dermatobacter hominis]
MPFERAKAALTGTRFADLRWVDETGSTNADVVSILGSQDPSEDRRPVVLVAGHQTAGRGRRDRTWEAPPGSSLLMTVGLPVGDIDPARWPLVNAAVALAVVDAAPDLRVKWPNDLVAPGVGADGADLKVGGILAELHQDLGGLGPCLVVGLGLNLNWGAMPDELVATATSLDILLGGHVDAEVVVTDLLVSLDSRWLGQLGRSTPNVDRLLDAYRSRSATIGRRISVELEAGTGEGLLTGTAVDVDASGALVVEDDAGEVRTVTVGDVVHLRPTD